MWWDRTHFDAMHTITTITLSGILAVFLSLFMTGHIAIIYLQRCSGLIHIGHAALHGSICSATQEYRQTDA